MDLLTQQMSCQLYETRIDKITLIGDDEEWIFRIMQTQEKTCLSRSRWGYTSYFNIKRRRANAILRLAQKNCDLEGSYGELFIRVKGSASDYFYDRLLSNSGE